MSDAGNQTVNAIGNTGNDKSGKSPSKVFIDDENDEEGIIKTLVRVRILGRFMAYIQVLSSEF